MKKILLYALLILLIACPVFPMNTAILSGAGGAPACSGAWCDNFNGGTGYLEDRAGWGDSRRIVQGDSITSRTACTNDELQRTTDNGMKLYTLADVTPADANYSVECKAKVTTDDLYVFGPIVRSKLGTDNTMTGYYVQIAGTVAKFYRIIDGINITQIGGNMAITDFDWASYHTVRLAISGVGATVTLTLFIDDGNEGTGDDEGATRIVDTNSGGLFTYWATDVNSYYDDYVHTD